LALVIVDKVDPTAMMLIEIAVASAPLAQLDRASVYGTEGCWFEPSGVYRKRGLAPSTVPVPFLSSIGNHSGKAELGQEMTTERPVVEILDPAVVEIMRQKSPAERLAQVFRIWETVRLVTRSSIRQQHPEWNDDQVLRETANRLSHGATERVPR
jgi:hypothetical protein